MFEDNPEELQTIQDLMGVVQRILQVHSIAGNLEEEEEEWLNDFMDLVERLRN